MAMDREGPLTIDGSGDLILSRNEHCLFLENTTSLCVKNINVYSARAGSRINRFLKLVPAVWAFCK